MAAAVELPWNDKHLDCGELGRVPFSSWDGLVRAHPGLTHGTFGFLFPRKEPVAFFDRNCLTEDCNRKVIVVRGGDYMYIFDEHGTCIDEPEHGVAKGQQAIQGETCAFIGDWQEEYYMLPTIGDVQKDSEDSGFAAVKSSLVEGKRIAVAFGDPDTGPVSWYGGQVLEHCAQTDKYKLGFDDGDLHTVSAAELESFVKTQCIRFPGEEEGGIIENVTGCPMVACAARTKEGRAHEYSIVGLLIGATGYKLVEDTIYMSFCSHAAEGAVAEDGNAANVKTRRTAASTNAKEPAKGLHTFRRGDIVQRNHVARKAQRVEMRDCRAHVFGVTWRERATDGTPGAKYLVLQEPKSEAFFIGSWTQWDRVHNTPNAELDDDSTTLVLSTEAISNMVKAFEASNKFEHLHNKTKVGNHVRHITECGPPLFEEEVKAAVKEQTDHDRDTRIAATKAKVKAARQQAAADKRRLVAEAKKESKRGKKRGKDKEPPTGKDKEPPTGKGEELLTDDVLELFHDFQGDKTPKRVTLRSDSYNNDEPKDNAIAIGDIAQQPPIAVLGVAPAASPPLQPPPRRSPRLSPTPLPPGWKSAVTTEGETYYYNKSLQLSQFQHPSATTTSTTVPSPPLAPPLARASMLPAIAPAPYGQIAPAAAQKQLPAPVPQPAMQPLHMSYMPVQQSAPSSSHVDTRMLLLMREQHRAQLAHAGTDHLRAYHAAEIAKYESMMW